MDTSKYKKLKKLISTGLKLINPEKKTYKVTIEVPKESEDWRVDDFLGNCLQYKIKENWYYEPSISLPFGDLEVIGLIEQTSDCKKIEILVK